MLYRILLFLTCLLILTFQSEHLNNNDRSSEENSKSIVEKHQKVKIIDNFNINEEIPPNAENYTSNRIKRDRIIIDTIGEINEKTNVLNCSEEYGANIINYYKNIQTMDFEINKITIETTLQGIALASSELIKKGFFDEAEKVMDGIDDIELIIEIIKNSYTGENEKELTEFIKKLDSDEHQSAAYSMLYEQMKKMEKLSNPIVIELLFHLNWLLTSKKVDIMTLEPRTKIIYYTTDENSIVDDAVETLANQDIQDIQQFKKNYRGSFDVITPIFIKHYYNGEIKNFDKVLNFLQADPHQWLSTKYKILDALFDEMKTFGHMNSQEILQFVQLVKNNYASHSTLIAKLPLTLKTLIFKDTIKIVSYSNNDYSVYMSKYGNVYTYPHENYEGGTNQKFTIERSFDDKKLYFRFKCVENSNILYSDEDHIYGDEKDTNSHWWRLNPRSYGTVVYFENKETGRVMNIGNFVTCSSSNSDYCSTVKGDVFFTNDNTQLWTIQ